MMLEVLTLCAPRGPRKEWEYTPPSWVKKTEVRGPLYRAGGKTVGQRRREAVFNATGDYVMFVDDDDLLLPGIEQVLPLLERGVEAVGANIEVRAPSRTYLSKQTNEGLSVFAPVLEWWPAGVRVPVRRDVAVRAAAKIPDANWGEDQAYAKWLLDRRVESPWCGNEPIQAYYDDQRMSLTHRFKETALRAPPP